MAESVRPSSGDLHPNPSDEQFLTVKHLASKLSMSIRTVWRLDASGKLPKSIRIGNSVRWRRSEIEVWMRAGCPDRDTWEQQKHRGN